MEVLIFIIAFVICVVVSMRQDSGGKKASKPPPARPPSVAPLQFRCRTESKMLEDFPLPIEILVFELRNLFISGDGGAPTLRVRLIDKTDQEDLPVLCAIDDLQAPNSLNFYSSQTLPSIPSGMVFSIDEFANVVSVPKEVLIFPRTGSRNIVATLEVVMHAKVIQRANTNFRVQFSSLGYIDGKESRERAEEMGIYLAMHLAAADGHIDKKEAQIVREWITTLISAVEGTARVKRKERLNKIITDAYSKAQSSSPDLDSIADEIEEFATMPVKYEIIELCMDVMKADGAADPNEVRELKRIANLIGLDEARYTALLDKRLAEVGTIVVGSSSDSLGSMVGITPGMTKEEIRKHLNKEYRKWNARVSHDDEKIRIRAEQMMDYIAEARQKYC